MAPKRRPRGSFIDPITLGYEVEREVKDYFDELAARAGVTRGRFFEEVVKHIPVTDRGLPTWWPEPEPEDGELPIDTA